MSLEGALGTDLVGMATRAKLLAVDLHGLAKLIFELLVVRAAIIHG